MKAKRRGAEDSFNFTHFLYSVNALCFAWLAAVWFGSMKHLQPQLKLIHLFAGLCSTRYLKFVLYLFKAFVVSNSAVGAKQA